MAEFEVVLPLVGGALIGLAAGLLMLLNGRVAGISGIFAALISLRMEERVWRVLFIAGLIAGGLIFMAANPQVFPERFERSLPAMAIAGLLVGFGTRLGGGCTSGHGVCGISRLSVRSIVATLTFILTGAITVYVVSHVMGGA
ncbi:MAG: YeeE/YedE family protein [SAR324 cluster bacterium]|nr:YeeE/YedE family protein [SAR324 cluster bacterium]MCZ6532735.1 YeeE/YedE family protein [SAR324 cluster bacterium]MCZ6557236.1 YeeE/YedE family protein [SAR324 cluster bacterium]MCZ6626995.1 YeeE/YedE family protein [SAR324 cluster bacterium]MCZ6645497.1 YeeE/YedE family protein [SAR324 cluster bacterium]